MIRFLKSLGGIVGLVCKASPFWFIVFGLVTFAEACATGFSVIVNTYAFTAITEATAFEQLIWPIIAFAGLLTAQQVLNGLIRILSTPAKTAVQGNLNTKLLRKTAEVDALQFETPAFLDKMNKAVDSVLPAWGLTNNLIRVFIATIPFLIINGAYLYSLQPILLISLLIMFIPSLANLVVRAKVLSKLEDVSAPIRRRRMYYEDIMTDREYFKETRKLGAFGTFRKAYAGIHDELNVTKWHAERKVIMIELGLEGVSLIGYLAVLWILFTLLMNGDISVGAFAGVFASIGSLFWMINGLVNRSLGQIAGETGKVTHLLEYLRMPSRKTAGKALDVKGDIVLDNVSFCYPEAETQAVRNVSLTIKSGETIAIVGSNGAGKSTLVRLISGLYAPTEGVVSVGGTDLQDVPREALFAQTSALFQRFMRYRMTLADNVAISAPEDMAVADNLVKAGVDVNSESFPEGESTMLSREFDGVDLSGGQWQRVALARCYHKAHGMIFLDEPTAAIDPIEETKVYKDFTAISEGKTAVIVTHRMGSAKIADKILVMNEGAVDDFGTHEELLARGGVYAEMWDAQAKWYQQEA